MRSQMYKLSAFAFLFLVLLLGPAVSRAAEITDENTGKPPVAKSDTKTDENTAKPPAAKSDNKADEDTGKPPAVKADNKADENTDKQPAAKSENKTEGPFSFGKRWDTHSYFELDVLFDHYRELFKQDVEANPIGIRLRRGGDWKYAAFHFDLTGGYSGSLKLKSPDTQTKNSKLGFTDISFRLNGVLPVLYGVMLQGGIMEETWAEFAYYETPQKQSYIFVTTGLGPDLMLSFCPIKYISLNFEYSWILLPFVKKQWYGMYKNNKDFGLDTYSASKSSFSTMEAGISFRPLQVLSVGFTYGEKKMSHLVTLQQSAKPNFSSANYYTALNLALTW